MRISNILPASIKQRYMDLLRYCDSKMNYNKFMDISLFIGMLTGVISFITCIAYYHLEIAISALIGLSIFIAIELVIYFKLSLSADKRARSIENVLPDALQLMAMNVRSGMTTDKALFMAARTEFGPLEKELSKAGKQVLTGKDIKYALLEMRSRVKSPMFDKTIRMIVEGIESGGELSDLLEQTSTDIQNTKLIQNEIRANVLMYAIFIFFAAGIGAPMLFGISSYLVEILNRQFSQFQVSQTIATGMNFMKGQVDIPAGFLVTFSLVSLAITSIFGSLIISAVKNGNEKEGIKYIPLLFILSVLIFFGIRSFVAGIFSGV